MRYEVMKYERIRNLRIDRGLTQKQVAEYLNIKQNTYSQYEIGVLNYPLEAVGKRTDRGRNSGIFFFVYQSNQNQHYLHL